MECMIQDGQVVSKDGKPIGDCCLMKGGKMMMVMNGKMMPMEKDMTMSDGTKCMVDGTCMMKDGKTVKLKEGEGIKAAGSEMFRVKGLSVPGSNYRR